jgi:hypothetical protein
MAGVFASERLEAQQYRLRLDTRIQSVAYRGVSLDSIPASEAIIGSTGGFETVDGFAVECPSNDAVCTFFRPGANRRGGPAVTTADLSLWGLGITGLRFRASARLGVDLGDADAWPGTDPAVQLIEGYAEYASRRVTLQAGRTNVVSRLGFEAFDGVKVDARALSRRLTVTGFGGWALARGVALPVTSPALNPLDDFQPGKRHVVWGLGASWSSGPVAVRSRYRREADSRTADVTSERLAVDGTVRSTFGLSGRAGADYDVAAGLWGSAEAALAYSAPNGRGAVEAGVRRYRPHFDLWTIWGAFSPVAYRAGHASVSAVLVEGVELRARGEVYAFDETETTTPLVDVEDHGWRWSIDGRYARARSWSLAAGLHRELGPGAGSLGFRGGVTFDPSDALSLAAHASLLERPLEFRFSDAKVWSYGADADYVASDRLRLAVGFTLYHEDRRRPDAAQFDWGQVRLRLGATFFLSSGAENGIHPAILRVPPGRVSR